MLAKVFTCALNGLEGILIEVEVDIASGLPFFGIVGLPDTAVQEAKERVRAALKNSHSHLPGKRIIVNLAPADLRKEGPAYDLPIAVGILLAGNEMSSTSFKDALFLGELSLDGTLRHTDGILPMVSFAVTQGIKRVFLPAVDAREAALIEGVDVYPVEALSHLVDHLSGHIKLKPYKPDPGIMKQAEAREADRYNFSLIKGQEHAKRALEIAAAGGHNVLMLRSKPPQTLNLAPIPC